MPSTDTILGFGNTSSGYPKNSATTVAGTGGTSGTAAPNPTASYGITPLLGGSSVNPVTVPASTAPTAVPIAEQQQQSVYNQLPQYGQSLSSVGSNIASETAGQLPQDVVNQITQSSAERGITTGMPGSGSSNANLEQALGLNSLALTQTGQQNLEGILPTLPGYGVSTSPSLYATPGLYEQASASAAGVGNANSQQNAALNAAQTEAAQQNAQNNPLINKGGGGTLVTGGTGASPSSGLGGSSGGTGRSGGTTGTAGTGTGSGLYGTNGGGGVVIGQGGQGTTGTTGTGTGSMSDIPTGNMDGGSPTGATSGQTLYGGVDPNDPSTWQGHPNPPYQSGPYYWEPSPTDGGGDTGTNYAGTFAVN